MAGNALQDSAKREIESRAYSFVALWAASIIVLYAITGYLAVRQLHNYRAQTARLRQGWLSPSQALAQPHLPHIAAYLAQRH